MRALLLGLAFAVFGWTSAAFCQGFDMARGGDGEIQVYADNGIEWHSDELRVIARGNAKAVRGEMTLTADTLTAYYRQGPTGSSEIWRIDADGNVIAANTTDTATGDKGTYDLDKAILVLRGKPAKLTTPTQMFTADDQLEYHELAHMAVLRGNAVADRVDKGNKLQADILVAHFKDKSQGGGTKAKPGGTADGSSMDLKNADAYNHVVLTTPQETVTGDRGDYNMDSGIATISGAVTIKRETNVLTGGYANVDLNTGISKLFGGTPGGDNNGKRVSGTFIPEKHDGDPKEGADKGRAVFKGSAPTPPSGGGP